MLFRIGIFTALQKYVRANHTTGLVWNSLPGANPPASGEVPAGQTTKPAGGGPPGAPPPPPPPPAGLLNDGTSGGGGKGDNSDRQALFAEINKGEGITSGLKKVTAEMQTHKNPNLRLSSNVPAGSKQGGAQASAAKPAAVDKPPKIELKDNKIWQIEYQKNNAAITVETDKKQAVYIYKCENSVVQIKGKVNSITMVRRTSRMTWLPYFSCNHVGSYRTDARRRVSCSTTFSRRLKSSTVRV